MEKLEITQYEFQSFSKNIDLLEEVHKETIEKSADTIQFISIRGNSYGSSFFKDFAEVIKKLPNLQKLDFSDIFVGRKKDDIPLCLDLISRSLINKNILAFDISHNALNIFGAQTISKYLEQANSLQKFFINNCGLGPEGVEIISNSLAKGCPNLETLAITRNRAEDKGAKAVGNMLKSCPKFKELHICDVIRKEGMLVLLQNLQCCTDLELLDLRDNFLKDEAAEEMGKLIQKCGNLKYLNLSDCNLQKDENKVIIQALKHSQIKLEKIGYNYNELNGQDANLFLDILLGKNPQIKRIDIKGNEFIKQNKDYYQIQIKEKGLEDILSGYESDEDDDANDLAQQFTDLKL